MSSFHFSQNTFGSFGHRNKILTLDSYSTPNGIRTRIFALRGQLPNQLVDRSILTVLTSARRLTSIIRTVKVGASRSYPTIVYYVASQRVNFSPLFVHSVA